VQTLIGKPQFRKAMDLYFSRYDGQAVTTEDFIQAMQDTSGIDLTQFRRWYDQAGTPVLDVSGQYNEQKQTFTLTIKQSCPPTPGQAKKEPFHLPLSMGLVSAKCHDMPTQLAHEKNPATGTRVLEIKKPIEIFEFIHVTEKPVPSLLRHFSAPVILHYPYTDEELLWLFRCDSDYFSRWEAGQEFTKRLILKTVKAIQQNQMPQMDQRLIQAFKEVLTHANSQYDYVALLLTLPGMNYVMQFMDVVDMDALHAAYEFVKKSLANALVAEFAHGYQQHLLHAYEYNQADMAHRCLKNRCLSYLVDTQQAQYTQLAFHQFNQSDNMTDTMGALQALINHDGEERVQALQIFYDKYQEQPLVVNKWFMLQAGATRADTLAQVKKLMQHPAFDIKNPNNVYALIGAFANNTVAFHDKSGEGYRFIADQVLAIDPINPHVAAVLIQPLSRWQKMDKPRQKYMQEQLHRIANAKLSKDVYEIVKKSLPQGG
jgi:aminopeptidase N